LSSDIIADGHTLFNDKSVNFFEQSIIKTEESITCFEEYKKQNARKTGIGIEISRFLCYDKKKVIENAKNERRRRL